MAEQRGERGRAFLLAGLLLLLFGLGAWWARGQGEGSDAAVPALVTRPEVARVEGVDPSARAADSAAERSPATIGAALPAEEPGAVEGAPAQQSWWCEVVRPLGDPLLAGDDLAWEPVPGAEVAVVDWQELTRRDLQGLVGRAAGGVDDWPEGSTDASGRLHLSVPVPEPPPVGAYQVRTARVLLPGDPGGSARVPVDFDATSPDRAQRIELEPHATVHVRIVDGTGRPRPGLAVRLLAARVLATRVLATRVAHAPLEGSGLGSAAFVIQGWSARSGSDGWAFLEGVLAGRPLTLEVYEDELLLQREENAVVAVMGEVVRLTRRLEDRARVTLRGTLRDQAGNAIAGATVRAVRQQPPELPDLALGRLPGVGGRKSVTDAVGEFVLEGVEVGRQTLVVEDPSARFRQLRKTLRVKASPAPVVLRASVHRTVRGRALTADGRPAPGTDVWVARPNQEPSARGRAATIRVRTGADGQFVLKRLPPGLLQLDAAGPGGRLGRPLDLSPGSQRIELRLVPGGTLRLVLERPEGAGRAADSGARPAEHGRLRVLDASGRVVHDGSHPLDGEVALHHLEPGQVSVLLTVPSVVSIAQVLPLDARVVRGEQPPAWVDSIEAVQVPAVGATPPVTLRPARKETGWLQVLRRGGVEAVEVGLHRNGFPIGPPLRLASRGGALVSLPAGSAELRWRGLDGSLRSLQVEVPLGRTRRVRNAFR